MHGFRILQRYSVAWCEDPSVPVAVDEHGNPLGYLCTQPAGHRSEHLARVDGEVVYRWPNMPSPVA